MQSKGAIRFVAIVLALVCLWQLAFTVVTKGKQSRQVCRCRSAGL